MKLIEIFLMCSALSCLYIGTAAADPANYGIWLQAVYSGHQAWAYYPYDPANPLTGGTFAPKDNGTSYFTVLPGTTIYRKYIIANNEPFNDSVDYVITGLPPNWGLTYTKRNPMVLNIVQFPSVGQGAQKSHQGFGSMVVTVPSDAAPGAYAYTIKATSGTGNTSTLIDRIIVGTGTISPTPTPTPAPTTTPTPTPTPNPGGNLLFDPGFEQGNVADSHWFGTTTSNYLKRNVEVTPSMAHSGTYSLHNNGRSSYARLVQQVPYGGHGFEASYWFYVTKSWPAAGMVWMNVVDSPSKGWDDETHYRGVGMDNRTYAGKNYFVTNYLSSVRPFMSGSTPVSAPADGWYQGIIRYDGSTLTSSILDSKGNTICSSSRIDSRFTPLSVVITAGCPGYYIDDLSYRTW